MPVGGAEFPLRQGPKVIRLECDTEPSGHRASASSDSDQTEWSARNGRSVTFPLPRRVESSATRRSRGGRVLVALVNFRPFSGLSDLRVALSLLA